MRLRVNGGSKRAWKGGALAVFATVATQVGAPAHAESLLDALAAAYQYSPQLDAERARLRATDEEIARANSGYRPLVDFNADVGREHSRIKPNVLGGSSTTSPRGYSVNLVQPVFRGFQTTNAVNEAEAAVRAGREILRNVEQQILQSAVSAYADVAAAQAVVRLRQDGLEFFNQELKATKDRFSVGEVTRTDVAQAEARRSLAVGDLDASNANLKSARAQYEQVVGHPPQSVAAPGWSTHLLPNSLNDAIAISSRENPIVVAALYTEQGARFTVDRIRGELLPSAQVEASFSERFDASDSIEEAETASLVGRLNVPIYTGGEVEARVRQAKHTHISRIQEIEQARAQAQSSVAQAWAQLQGAKAQHEADKAQIKANRTALDGVREEEKVGQRTLLDVLNARQELLVSEIQAETTKRNIIVATYAVISAIGRLNVAELGAVGNVYDPVIHADEVRRKWFGIDITHDDGRREHHDVWQGEVSHEPVK